MEKRQIVVPFMLLMTFAAASAVNAMSIGEAVNAPELDWQTEGVPMWIGESDVLASDGQHHAIARGTVNNTNSVVSTRVWGEGVISFNWSSSLASRNSRVQFLIDEVVVGMLNGTNNAVTATFSVEGDGAHELKWRLSTGRSGASASDFVILDQVIWEPAEMPTLADALNTNLTWETTGDVPWTAMLGIDGAHGACAVARGLLDFETGVLQTRVYGEGILSFRWAISCEEEYDWMELTVDGEVYSYITGRREWTEVLIEVPGKKWHTISWEYIKDDLDDPVLAGDNQAMLDDVVWQSDDVEDVETGLPDLTFALFGNVSHGLSVFTTARGAGYYGDVCRLFDVGDGLSIGYGWANFGQAAAIGTVVNRVEVLNSSGDSVFSYDSMHELNLPFGAGYASSITPIFDSPLKPDVYRIVLQLDVNGQLEEETEWNNSSIGYVFAVRDPVPLAEALDCDHVDFHSDDGAWYGTKDATGSLSYARTKHLGNSSTNRLCAVLTGAGVLSFRWKVSSSRYYDLLEFLVDGTVVGQICGTDGDWAQFNYEIGAGEHVVEWRYCKDETHGEGLDCAWLDQVSWVQGDISVRIGDETILNIDRSWFETGMLNGRQIFDPAVFAEKFGTDYALAAKELTGKHDVLGNPMYVWQDYVAGTDPTDPTSKFTVRIEMKGGKPVVTWDPTMNGKNADGTYIKKGVREYAIKGSTDLKNWYNVDDGEEGNYNFFKVIVEMPKVE